MNVSTTLSSRPASACPPKIRLLTVLAAALALMVAGCSGPSTTAPVMGTRYSLADTEKVMLMDGTVQQAVECTGLQVINRKDGRLEVIASLKNMDHNTFVIEVGAAFKGPAGEDLDDRTAWHRLILEGNNTVIARFVSKDARAADFAVQVRTAK